MASYQQATGKSIQQKMQTDLFDKSFPEIGSCEIPHDFDFTLHEKENNRESENNLNDNRKHFSKKCKLTLELLLQGKHLQVLQAANEYRIHSLPRRIGDLKLLGISIEAPFIPGTRLKEYYLLQEEINRVKQLYNL